MINDRDKERYTKSSEAYCLAALLFCCLAPRQGFTAPRVCGKLQLISNIVVFLIFSTKNFKYEQKTVDIYGARA